MAVRHSPRRHPTGGRVTDPPVRAGRRRIGWVLLLVIGALVFVGLRVVHATADASDDSAIFTDRVVVVGVTDRAQLTPTDRTVLGAHLDDAQVGSVSVRPRYLGSCAAAGWTTLGAGRRAAVGDLCSPTVTDGRVTDWASREQAAAARRGDAHLGTLADSVTGCVAAVGPGAAVAAAKADGSVSRYINPAAFVAAKLKTECPITLVDAGSLSDQIITGLAADPKVTLIVTGIGPPAGSTDPSLQVIYRLGTTLPGYLTSASTRRTGIVTLTDLTRTLIDFGDGEAAAPATVDGAPLAVDGADLTVSGIERQIAAVTALSNSSPVGYAFLGFAGLAVVATATALVVTRRLAAARTVLVLPLVLAATMMLAGSVPWERNSRPGLFLCVLVSLWWLILAAVSLLVARLARAPVVIAATAVTVAAYTFDAALGAPMQPGSLLNSRPIYGLRWYGFGNVTFAVYASAGLLLAGYVAHRRLAAGHRRRALFAVGAIGFGIVVCEGWPSMGTDFGGVIALTPVVLWLLLVLSGLKVTWPKLLAVGGAAVLAIALISYLDWRRGPDRRSHLGNFVQRVIEGDAVDVVSRKAVASAETFVSALGIPSLILGIVAWILIFRYVLPAVTPTFSTLRVTLWAIVATGVLGTLLNDGGISVWLAASGATLVACVWMCVDLAEREGWTIGDFRAVRR